MTNPVKILLALALSPLVACGSSVDEKCQDATCGTPAVSYKICAVSNGVTTYKYATTSCACSQPAGVDCAACASQTAAYCGEPANMCKATLSGAVAGTVACEQVVMDAKAGTWTISTAGGAVSGPSDAWNGFTMNFSGTPAVGTFDLAMSTSSSANVKSNDEGEEWDASYSDGTAVGTATLQLTSLGASAVNGDTTVYAGPHGAWNATLAAGVGAMGTITIAATF